MKAAKKVIAGLLVVTIAGTTPSVAFASDTNVNADVQQAIELSASHFDTKKCELLNDASIIDMINEGKVSKEEVIQIEGAMDQYFTSKSMQRTTVLITPEIILGAITAVMGGITLEYQTGLVIGRRLKKMGVTKAFMKAHYDFIMAGIAAFMFVGGLPGDKFIFMNGIIDGVI